MLFASFPFKFASRTWVALIMAVPRTTQAGILRRQISTGNNILTFPLITIFTPSATCTQPVLWISSGFSNHFIVNTSSNTLTVFKFDGACYPTSFYLNATASQSPLYSPGVCPSGFTSVRMATWLNPETTYATCCPRYERRTDPHALRKGSADRAPAAVMPRVSVRPQVFAPSRPSKR